MSPVLSRSRPSTLGAPRRRAASAALVVLATLGLVAAIRLLPQPLPVDDLTIVNPYPWAASVEVGSPDGATLAIGRVPREQTRTFTDVPRMGSVVAVRFGYHGFVAEVQVDRRDLVAGDGRVEVPASFADELRDAGVRPTPPPRGG
jgi:hypothetical protein